MHKEDVEEYVKLRDQINELKEQQSHVAHRLRKAVDHGTADERVSVSVIVTLACPDLEAVLEYLESQNIKTPWVQECLKLDCKKFLTRLDGSLSAEQTDELELFFDSKTTYRLSVKKV